MNKIKTISNILENRKCFITGHTGFKGSWLSLMLNKLGAKVYGYSLNPPTNPSLFIDANIESIINDIRGDIRDFNNLKKVLDEIKPEFVFHLAAQSLVRESYINPKETFETNVCGTINLLEALRENDNVKVIIIVTSDKCYRNEKLSSPFRENDPLGGHDPYSGSKAAAEMVVGAYKFSYFDPKNVPVASVRSGNVIGGGDWANDRLIPDIIKAVMKNEALIIRNPSYIRPWQHVLEPLYGYITLCSHLYLNPKTSFEGNHGWNFGPENYSTVFELANKFKAYFDNFSLKIRDTLDEMKEAETLKLNSERAFNFLGWKNILNFDYSIKMTAEWYKQYLSGVCAKILTEKNIEEFFNHI